MSKNVYFIDDKKYKKCGIDLGVRTFGTIIWMFTLYKDNSKYFLHLP
jgi:hypothetical protein